MRRFVRWAPALLALVPALARAGDPPPAAGKPAAPPPAAAKEPGAQPVPDVFAEVVKDAGLAPDEIGFRPKATWARYPVVVPWKMPFFDDLLAHPEDTYEFTRTLGNVVEDLLTPESLSTPPKDGPGSLYKLGVVLGTDRRIGGFRGFGFGLYDPKPADKEPLADALVRLLTRTGDPVDPKALAEKAAIVPEPLRLPLARLVLALLDARTWIDRGLRDVPRPMQDAVWKALPDLLEGTPDAGLYVPELEDAARHVDEPSLHYGCLKALEAVQRARWELEAVPKPEKGWPEFEMRLATAWGTVDFDRNPVNPQRVEEPFVIVRLWAGNALHGSVGATGPGRPLSVALLMGEEGRVGEDAAADLREGPPSVGGLATGVFGCGLVYTAGAASNDYRAGRSALGFGLIGMGVLVDEGGNDVYTSLTGQGGGYFGAGLLLDAAGNDEYHLIEGDGQGYGGPFGIGVLADRSGNDRYLAEPTPEKAGKQRADYHSDQKIVGSNAQGAGMGRRGDVGDGHSWAGGLGVLIDVDGNDVYEAGNFSQGAGYWFGTGLLWDGGGDDVYRSVYFSHASGAHFAVGAVIDEGGDDQHLLYDFAKVGLGPKAGAGLAFGWDVVNAILIDRAGNDRYEANIISIGCADVRSHAWLIDEGGNDTYVLDEGAQGFAGVDEAPTYVVPSRGAPFAFHLPQTAFLLDLGGTDAYLRRPKAGGDPVPDAQAGDGRSWGRDGPRGPGGGPNVARGRDVARGRIGFLDAWPRRGAAPSAGPAGK